MTVHRFSDAEALRIAAEMERRGEQFYRHAALLSREPETKQLLLQLAEEERIHLGEFLRLSEREGITEIPYDEETNAYLSAIAADVVFSEGLMALKQTGFDSPDGILREAIASEKDSVLFYTELTRFAGDGDARRIFEEIIRQEKGHMNSLLKRRMRLCPEGE